MVLENFNIALTALRANQIGLDITGHNIANVNTPGYVRQRAEFITNYPQDKVPGQLGTGVLVDEIKRLNDSFTQLQLEIESRSMGQFTVEREIMQELENVFSEPSDTGLMKAVSDFFAAWQSLADSPEDFGARSVVVQKSVSLADQINATVRQLNAIKDEIDESVRLKVDEVNRITGEIADLNDQIAKVEVGGVQNANDLRDKRDLLLIELNKIIDIRYTVTQSDVLLVETTGGVLVSGVHNIELSTDVDSNGHLVPVVANSGSQILPAGGELAGYINVRDNILNEYIDKMNTFAQTMIEEVNRMHTRGAPLEQFTRIESATALTSAGIALNDLNDWDYRPKSGSFTISVFDANGTFTEEQTITVDPGADTLTAIVNRINAAFTSGAVTASVSSTNQLVIESSGGYSFNFVDEIDGTGDSSDFLLGMGINTFFTGNSALTMAVSEEIRSDYSLIAAAKSSSAGDNRTALDIAALQNTELFENDTTTFEDIYRTWVSDVGSRTDQALSNEERQESVIQLLEERMAQTTGVSLDEEATNILKFQRAYQAAGKLVSIANTLFQTLLDM
jgi:flagellar hook-associated protein 1